MVDVYTAPVASRSVTSTESLMHCFNSFLLAIMLASCISCLPEFKKLFVVSDPCITRQDVQPPGGPNPNNQAFPYVWRRQRLEKLEQTPLRAMVCSATVLRPWLAVLWSALQPIQAFLVQVVCAHVKCWHCILQTRHQDVNGINTCRNQCNEQCPSQDINIHFLNTITGSLAMGESGSCGHMIVNPEVKPFVTCSISSPPQT